jgi:5-formyltetrahydrofolate cyclo-ligase
MAGNETKERIRNTIKERFRSLSRLGEVGKMSEDVVGGIYGHDCYKKARVIMAYMPIWDEVDILPLILKALSEGRTIVVPKCDPVGRTMSVYAVENLDYDLSCGFAGILEPDVKKRLPYTESIDLILVPGRAFDLKGNRLGRGQGYYDRFLVSYATALKVGVAFDFQVLKQIEVSEHDVSMNYVVTEKRILGYFNN